MISFPINRIRSGDILAVSRRCSIWKPSTWLAARIQKTTRSKWNHVGLLVRDVDSNVYVIEALWVGGVVKRPLGAYYCADADLAIARPAYSTITQAATAAAFALHKIGKQYDKMKIITIRLLQLVVGSDVVEMIRAEENDDVYICSELVIRSWRAAGRKVGEAFSGPGEVMKHATIYWETTKAK